MNKHACSASCPCQQGKDQAIAEKVARRFLQADVEVGRGIFTPQNLKIHRYRESVEVTDMTNAGKRGKKVSVMHVSVGSMASNMVDVALKNLTSEILHMNYAAAKNHVEKVIASKRRSESLMASGSMRQCSEAWMSSRWVRPSPSKTNSPMGGG